MGKPIANPLLPLLLPRTRRARLWWRIAATSSVLLAIGGIALLLGLLIWLKDDSTRARYEDYFSLAYSGFIIFSLALPLATAVLGAIFTSNWKTHDEKFDLLRLTPVPNELFVRASFLAGWQRLRVLSVIHIIFAILMAMATGIQTYWGDQRTRMMMFLPNSPNPSIYYVGIFLIALTVNIALCGLSIIGVAVGIKAGLRGKTTNEAIFSAIYTILGALLVISFLSGVAILFSGTLYVFFENNPLVMVTFGTAYSSLICLVPIYFSVTGTLKAAYRHVR